MEGVRQRVGDMAAAFVTRVFHCSALEKEAEVEHEANETSASL